MPLLPRRNIADLKECKHGGLDYAELERLGIAPDAVIDFSVNLSPSGVPLGIRPLVKSIRLLRYPDSQSIKLRSMIARKTGLSVSNVMVGSGSTEIIRLVALAYLNETDNALIMEPTYGEYRVACEIAGAQVITQTLSAEDAFSPDIDITIELIKRIEPKVIFICNPNNPTGGYLNQNRFQRILSVAPDSLVVLDEAYISFVRQSWSSPELINKGNLLIVRSMTKDYALAGLRLGYALAGEKIIETLRRVCPPWNVDVVAQHAGIVALQQENYLKESQELVYDGKRYLTKGIRKLGFRCLPSKTNFFLVEVGNASELRNQLLARGILVRDCTSFGLPECIRIASRTIRENRKLITALKEINDEK
ncbi:pyridoxal phosphate-dependent aminotransferase [Chloroflexota bacterium]